ncbi:MAG TPA: alpha/beta hydrolase [Bryobacteraceae bacterium]|jgi:pimeloyl-ACP methyl ester carboxylesterase|nr:alpha/beta hydrolase [Bryobacteraceae bacterium]
MRVMDDAERAVEQTRRLRGEAWFETALTIEPERSGLTVDGHDLELLTWGERGRPGLLFCHGLAASADWWRFIAPHYACSFRVAAFSWGGTGRSDWRKTYSIERCIREYQAIMDAAGLFDGGKPAVIGHSFGGFPLLRGAAQDSEGWSAIILADTNVPRLDVGPQPAQRQFKSNLTFVTVEESVAKFRLMPDPPRRNPQIVEFLARAAVSPIRGSWGWRSDPDFYANFEYGPGTDRLEAHCPVTLLYGEHSSLLTASRLDRARQMLRAPDVHFIKIADSGHHMLVDQPEAVIGEIDKALARVGLYPEAGQKSGIASPILDNG